MPALVCLLLTAHFLSPPSRLEAEREERLAGEAAGEKTREEEEKKEKHKQEWLQARLEWNQEILNKQRMKRRHRIREQTLVMKNKFNARWIVKRAELVAAARKEVPDNGASVGLRPFFVLARCSEQHAATTTPHHTTPHSFYHAPCSLRAGAKLPGQPAQHVRDPPQHQGAQGQVPRAAAAGEPR